MVIAQFAKQLDTADFLADRAEQVDAIKPAADRAIGVLVIPQDAAGRAGDAPTAQAKIAADHRA